MEREEIIKYFEGLLEKKRIYEMVDSELDEAKAHQQYLNSLNEHSLMEFDLAQKENYILKIAGPEPQPFIFKTQGWQDRHYEWQKSREYAEKKYFEVFKEQREELQIDRILERRDKNLQRINTLEKQLQEIKNSMNSEEFPLGSDIQNSENISALIEILKNHRADTLKEAVNVLYDDLFRQEIEARLCSINRRLNSLEERGKSCQTDLKELKARVEDTRDWLQMVQDRVEDLEDDEEEEDEDEDDEYDNAEDEDEED